MALFYGFATIPDWARGSYVSRDEDDWPYAAKQRCFFAPLCGRRGGVDRGMHRRSAPHENPPAARRWTRSLRLAQAPRRTSSIIWTGLNVSVLILTFGIRTADLLQVNGAGGAAAAAARGDGAGLAGGPAAAGGA